MAEQLISDDGHLFSPYLIFIQQPHAYSDKELLALFKLGRYKRSPTSQGRHVVFADAGDWTLVSDDGLYTLWHKRSTRRAIQKIAKWNNVFACSVGEPDRSFDYHYYVDGDLVREYIVHSPNCSDRKVHKDRGELLLGESELLAKDGFNIGIEVAATLGIKTKFKEEDLRIFVPPRYLSP